MNDPRLDDVRDAFAKFFRLSPHLKVGEGPEGTLWLPQIQIPLATFDGPHQFTLTHGKPSIYRTLSAYALDQAVDKEGFLYANAEDTLHHAMKRDRDDRLKDATWYLGEWFVTHLWMTPALEIHVRVGRYEVR